MAMKKPQLTPAQCDLLIRLINIMEAGYWSEGDYCLTKQQFDTLIRAREKLEEIRL